MTRTLFISFAMVYGLLMSPLTLAEVKPTDRFSVDLKTGDDGDINPEVFIPKYWSKQWFSGIDFSSRSLSSESTVAGFSDSKLGTSIDRQQLSINLISYQASGDGFKYSIGGAYKLNQIDRSEFGYFRLNNGLVDDYVAFDNLTDIEVRGLSLRGDITWGEKGDDHQFRISAVLSPADKLDVEQNTEFKPIVPTRGVGSSSKSLDLGYDLKFQTRHKLSEDLGVGFVMEYQLLPLKYDIQVLAATADRFQSATIDTEETRTAYAIRLIFFDSMVQGLDLVIGLGIGDTETRDNVTGSKSSDDQSIYSIGFTGNF